MANAEGIIIGAGSIAFIGNFFESGGFPSNGYKIIGATFALLILASTVKGRWETPVKWLAVLMLLAAVYRYVPAFTTKATPKKGKTNG